MRSNRARLLFVLASLSALLLLTAVGGPVGAPARDAASKAIAIFADVFTLTRSNYVEPVETRQLLSGAYDGMTDAVDAFSYYVSPEKMAAYKAFRAARGVDPGIILARRGGYGYVVAPVPGSAAEKAGVRSGDLVVSVDDKSTRNLSLWEIEAMLVGPEGTTLKLVVLRGGEVKEPISMTRVEARPPPVSSRWEKDVIIVRVPGFVPGARDAVRRELEEAQRRGIDRAIVDLRGTPGGSEEEAVRTASLFVPPGAVAKLVGRKDPNKTYETPGPAFWKGKTVVLIDEGTCGAAEILAAALRERAGATLVGEASVGRAIVQRFIPTDSGGGVYLTVARFETPGGKVLGGRGLTPDVRVDVLPEEPSGRDPILDRGLKVIRGSVPPERKAA